MERIDGQSIWHMKAPDVALITCPNICRSLCVVNGLVSDVTRHSSQMQGSLWPLCMPCLLKPLSQVWGVLVQSFRSTWTVSILESSIWKRGGGGDKANQYWTHPNPASKLRWEIFGFLRKSPRTRWDSSQRAGTHLTKAIESKLNQTWNKPMEYE